MLETITPEVLNKLGEIGFEEDEISAIQILHELKTRPSKPDIRELINQAVLRSLSEGIAKTFEKSSMNEEAFFNIVEQHRREKKK
jgi:hypothetical protein